MTEWIGKTLGRVYIESRLARGGMAEVYLGTHTTLGRKVAVKILRPYSTDDPRLRIQERFELEARAVARLRHPNIVQVFDFATVDDQPYLVMEYIPGPPLSKYLSVLHARGGRLGTSVIGRLLSRIAGALQYAHESGVIHRDVKPGNILLSSRSIQIVPGETLPLDLEPVLTDFGLVRFLNASRQTASGLVTGTPSYMSPEQARGEAADGRTDIYSLGIVLYEMLNGQVPFDGESTVSILLKHLNETPPPIPGLSPALQRVLDRALAKDPDDRYQHPRELSAAFDHALEHTDSATTMAAIPQVLGAMKENRAAPVRRRVSLWPAVLSGAMILLIGAALLFSRGRLSAEAAPPTASLSAPGSTSMLMIPATFGPTGSLQFSDGAAILDRATLTAQAMSPPPRGNRYAVWLVNGEERLSLGALQLDELGRGRVTFDDPQQRNLLAYYSKVEVTIEAAGSVDTEGSARLAYAYALPEAGTAYLRGLIVSFPETPQQVSLIHGLERSAQTIRAAGQEMYAEHEGGDLDGVKEQAEAILNLLVGSASPDHRDWNNDGALTDPGDGYGFFLNGSSPGYIQAVYAYTDYAVNSPGATRSIIAGGEDVKTCAENLAYWAPELRDHVSIILGAETLADIDYRIQRSADLADLILNGIDLNENGAIEPVADECGVRAAYEAMYRMADMPLLPVAVEATPTFLAISPTPFQTATLPLSLFAATPTGGRDESPPAQTGVPSTVVPSTNAAPTDEPPPPATDEPRPSKEPPPTKEPRPTREPQPTKEPRPTKEPKPTNGPPGNP